MKSIEVSQYKNDPNSLYTYLDSARAKEITLQETEKDDFTLLDMLFEVIPDDQNPAEFLLRVGTSPTEVRNFLTKLTEAIENPKPHPYLEDIPVKELPETAGEQTIEVITNLEDIPVKELPETADEQMIEVIPKSDVEEYICKVINARFVLIPAGTFMMGSPQNEPGRRDNETLHQVTISRSFYMQTTEVTQGQWQKIMGSNPSYFKGNDDLPVELVSWYNVQNFIEILNRQEETDKYRLPTEAEWEYACRAGSTTAYCFGDNSVGLGEYAWYEKSGRETHPIGLKKANAWGLHDMPGNVWEWVQDWYGGVYPSGHVTDPVGPSSGASRLFRGGSWVNKALGCRSAIRGYGDPGGRVGALGFRLVRTL